MINNDKFYSKYAMVFDSDCPGWENSQNTNMYIIETIEKYFNDVLRYREYVFLRDIYEKLGWPITRDSIVIGWHLDNPDCADKIKFTIYRSSDESDPDLIVDFNVDGDITEYFK